MNARAGMFYAVGVGPGNPAWMTRVACDVLGFCPVIAAPKNAAGEMAALEVARGAVDLSRKSILPLKFTVARAKSTRKAEYVRSAGSIARVLDAGLSVAMVNLGDVSIYATAYYVLDELRRQGYATQMIPGITSFCAVAATLGTSLTDMDAPLHIYPGETDNLDTALELSGTKVLMKSGKTIGETAAALSCRGLAKEASMVADCGMPSQKVFSEMTDLPENVGVFSTVIVPGLRAAARKK